MDDHTKYGGLITVIIGCLTFLLTVRLLFGVANGALQ